MRTGCPLPWSSFQALFRLPLRTTLLSSHRDDLPLVATGISLEDLGNDLGNCSRWFTPFARNEALLLPKFHCEALARHQPSFKAGHV